MKIAVCFFTHLFDDSIARRYKKLRRELAGRASVFVLAEQGTPLPEAVRPHACFFDFNRLRLKAVRVLGENIVPGSCHLAFLAFHDAHPDFDYYWFIEYDVVFTGDWNTLLDGVADDTSDLIATHVRGYANEPGWFWWDKTRLLGNEDTESWMRAFFPVARISRRGLEAVSRKLEDGWTGHQEAIVPTAIRASALSITELGGDGPLTPPHRRHRFYVSISSGNGELLFGTMRWTPPHFLPLCWTNTIFHPVKARRLPDREDLARVRHQFRLLLTKGIALSWIRAYCRLKSTPPRRPTVK